MKKACVLLDHTLKAEGLVSGTDYSFVLNVHDEWQMEVKEEFAELAGKSSVHAIRASGERFNFRCPLNGEFRIGNNWAETH